MSKPWRRYSTGRFFDELITRGGSPRMAARRAVNFFKGLSADELQARRAAAELERRAVLLSKIYLEVPSTHETYGGMCVAVLFRPRRRCM